MRKKSFILVFLFAFLFVMADTNVAFLGSKKVTRMNDFSHTSQDTVAKDNDDQPERMDTVTADTIKADALSEDLELPLDMEQDTVNMDSLQMEVFRHNKAIDDSIRLDSLNRQKKSGLDAPVKYKANDSLVYIATTNTAHLYGSSEVKYQNMNLSSDKIYMSLDSNLVHATPSYKDTTRTELVGKPVFDWGNDHYESDTMSFNFKTKKGFINQVYTEQEDGYLSSQHSKRDSSGVLFLEHGRYTTCDAEHPDFYIALSRAKVRPGKDVVFGPAYLVVCDVPLPLAIPYGFFPFTKSYSSGFIMPTYGDESTRGFYLREGGYYFAMSDKWDLKLLGEIYTKGSWGITATTNYRKRYKYSGSFYFNYQDTKTGDKGMPDFTESESFTVRWSHRQDAKANPFSTLSASVNFATTNYERNNLNSLYNPQAMTQSTRTSSVNYHTGFSSIGLSMDFTFGINQNMRDSTIALTLPDINFSVSRFYPFKRKKAVGDERWYEKIGVTYNGQISNSINTKENMLMKSNLVKDWKNGMSHKITTDANFTLFNFINVKPGFSLQDYMYTHKIERSWDEVNQKEVNDTIYGFNNLYQWNMSMGFSTTMYGRYVPSRKLFGDKVQAIRHVLTPSVSFSYRPDFGSSRYGYWKTYQKTDASGKVTDVEYSPFSDGLFGQPSKGKNGSVSFTLQNNLEMKIKSEKDSTGFKKISLIDDLTLSMSYNMAAKTRPWSDLTMSLRLKLSKSYTFNLNTSFATYAYELDEDGNPYLGERTEYSYGRFGRFQGMTQSLSYTLTPDKIKKFFSGSDEDDDKDRRRKGRNNDEDEEGDFELQSNIDDDMERGMRSSPKKNSGKAKTDADGYMSFSMPWSLTFSYGITLRENTSGTFNKDRMRYPYAISQNLNFNGNIRLSDGWNIQFRSGYDFDMKKLSMTTASLSRDLHCFNMSCSVVLAPMTSYNFSFRCNASTLTDALKYDKRSGYSNAVQWY